MADKKISQLTGATTPLAGTEVLPIVQSGSTVKVSVANLTAGRSTSVGFLDVAATAGKVGNFNTTDANGLYLTGQTNGSSRWDIGSAKQVFNGGTEADFGLGTRGGYLALGVNAEHLKIVSGGNVTVSTGNLVVGTAAKGIDFSANTGAAGMTSELLNWYEEGTWTPANVGMTVDAGSWAATGTYTRIGRVVYFTVTQTSGTVSAAAGTDCISGFPFAPAVRGVVSFTNGAATLVGVGIVDLDSKFYNSAAITSQTALRITGWYQV
jgi:hypothetical protein